MTADPAVMAATEHDPLCPILDRNRYAAYCGCDLIRKVRESIAADILAEGCGHAESCQHWDCAPYQAAARIARGTA